MGTDIHGIFQRRTEAGWEDVETKYEETRHYALFAWLGNVRNGRGFAGTLTHSRITPLSDCRGYPEGFVVKDDNHPIARNSLRGPRRSSYYADEDSNPRDDCYLELWMGDHSHSWLSAAEILAATPPRILRTGYVPVETFKAWDGTSSPEEWSGFIAGGWIVLAETTPRGGAHAPEEVIAGGREDD